ncbi:MAG: hypothetical protein KDB53_08910 [Planctomycetes bacterium]|nr:hypothetical protein [Planctomycetota bacterium]
MKRKERTPAASIDSESIRKLLATPTKLHFVGVGGLGMSGLAGLLARGGFKVTGSEETLSDESRRVASAGIPVHEGHDSSALPDELDGVVVAASIDEGNPELEAARSRGLPIVRYAEALAAVAAGRESVAVAGTYGKTTTAAMLLLILREAGLDPGAVIGGIVPQLRAGDNRDGKGRPFVMEASEHAASFELMRPRHAIITNLGLDNPESFGSADALRQAFRRFAGAIDPAGLLVTTSALARDLDLRGASKCRVLGIGPRRSDVRIRVDDDGFLVLFPDGRRGPRVRLSVPGRHNVINAAMAAISAQAAFDVDVEVVRSALEGFRGVARRFEYRLEGESACVIDDSALHPTEIEATLLAARHLFPHRRLVAVFQPRGHESSLRSHSGLLNALSFADEVHLLRERQAKVPLSQETTAFRLSESLTRLGFRSSLSEDPASCVDAVFRQMRRGDVTVVMGTGEVGAVSHDLARLLR